jgi:hypothetical protein
MNVTHKEPTYIAARCDWIRNCFHKQDVFIIGGGPSLFGFDFSRLEGRRVIAINHSYRYCKPEILVFLDSKFLKETRDMGHDVSAMPFKIIAGPSSGMKSKGNCTVVQLAQKPTNMPGSMYGRAQSGLVAINAALVGNAKNIYLLGFDAKFRDGRGHFYSDDFKHTMDHREEQYKRMTRNYNAFMHYKNIFNCCPDSNISAFEKITIDKAVK